MRDVQALSSSGTVFTTSKDQIPSKDTSSRVAVACGRSIVILSDGVMVRTLEMAYQISSYVMYFCTCDPSERTRADARSGDSFLDAFLGAIGFDCRACLPRVRDVPLWRTILCRLLIFRPWAETSGEVSHDT
jgi:hypothetical protein